MKLRLRTHHVSSGIDTSPAASRRHADALQVVTVVLPIPIVLAGTRQSGVWGAVFVRVVRPGDLAPENTESASTHVARGYAP
jgi:hypothetical protein